MAADRVTAAARLRARIFADREAAAAALAMRLARRMRKLAASQPSGGVTVALAGGETPQQTYRLLQAQALPWQKIDFYPTDERCVPARHPRRNDAMLRRALGAQARVSALRENAVPPPLHIALLGMGEDGHTASLFADTLAADSNRIHRVKPASVPEARLTMPLSAFATAAKVFLLFYGDKKWRLLSRPPPPVAALFAAAAVEIFYAP